MAAFPDQRIDWLAGPEGLMARRSWELVPGPRSVLLKGLLGFPWAERDVQAKCTRTEYAGRTGLFGPLRVDRHHTAVPAAGCTCGIYAMEEPETRLTSKGFLARRVLVHGFVRLSGRILYDGTLYRAERARIEGPLVIAVPGPRRPRARRAGPAAACVFVEGERYRVAYGVWAKATRGAMALDAWHRTVANQLEARYGVPVERRERPLAA